MGLKAVVSVSGNVGPVTPIIVGPTGNYATIQEGVNAAVTAGASASAPVTVFIQNGAYPETATSHIITMATGVNLTALDQLYNGIIFDAANAAAEFNFDGGVEIQADFIFTRTSSHCYNNFSNVYINPPISSSIFESPAGLVLNNVLVALNSGCTAIHTTPATLGASGRSDISLNSSFIIPPAASGTRRAVVMPNTTLKNTLRITLTNSAIYDVTSSTMGTGSSNILNNNLEIFLEAGANWTSQINGADATALVKLKAYDSSYGKGLTEFTTTSTMFNGVLRGTLFTSNTQNWCATTWVGLDNTNAWVVTMNNDLCTADTYLWDYRPLSYKLFNVTTNAGVLNSGSASSSSLPTAIAVANQTHAATTNTSPTVIGNITIPENSSIVLNGTISGSKSDTSIIEGFTYSIAVRRGTGTDITLSSSPIVNTFPTSGGGASVAFSANTSSGTEGLDITITALTGTYYWSNVYQYNLTMVQ